MISKLLYQAFEIYWWIIIIKVFLEWIPNVNWDKQPAKILALLVDPYLEIFSKFTTLPSGLSLSPIIALILLRLVQVNLVALLTHFGM